MAADNELRMISRAIRDRDLGPLLAKGIDETWFENDDAKQIFTFAKRHLGKYNEVPTATTVKDNFPTIPLLAVQDTIEYLVDQFVAYRKNCVTHDALQQAVALWDSDQTDHESVLAVFQNGLDAVDRVGATDVIRDIDLTDDPWARWDRYEDLANNSGGMLGMPTGFATIDLATGGLQPGQLVFIVAPPKTGKSVLQLQVATSCHKSGKTPWLMSWEMTITEQETRHDAFRSKIAHARLIRGTLEQHEESRYKQMLSALAKDAQPFYLADSTSATTVPAIAAKLNALPALPDLVCLDGTYFIVDHRSGEVNTPRALTNITRDLKNLAIKIKRPILATTQVLEWKMKGNKVTAGSIGYSSSFHQDADVILGLEKTEEDDPRTRVLKIVASRNCGPAEVELLWDWEQGEFKEYEPDDEDEDVEDA